MTKVLVTLENTDGTKIDHIIYFAEHAFDSFPSSIVNDSGRFTTLIHAMAKQLVKNNLCLYYPAEGEVRNLFVNNVFPTNYNYSTEGIPLTMSVVYGRNGIKKNATTSYTLQNSQGESVYLQTSIQRKTIASSTSLNANITSQIIKEHNSEQVINTFAQFPQLLIKSTKNAALTTNINNELPNLPELTAPTHIQRETIHQHATELNARFKQLFDLDKITLINNNLSYAKHQHLDEYVNLATSSCTNKLEALTKAYHCHAEQLSPAEYSAELQLFLTYIESLSTELAAVKTNFSHAVETDFSLIFKLLEHANFGNYSAQLEYYKRKLCWSIYAAVHDYYATLKQKLQLPQDFERIDNLNKAFNPQNANDTILNKVSLLVINNGQLLSFEDFYSKLANFTLEDLSNYKKYLDASTIKQNFIATIFKDTQKHYNLQNRLAEFRKQTHAINLECLHNQAVNEKEKFKLASDAKHLLPSLATAKIAHPSIDFINFILAVNPTYHEQIKDFNQTFAIVDNNIEQLVKFINLKQAIAKQIVTVNRYLTQFDQQKKLHLQNIETLNRQLQYSSELVTNADFYAQVQRDVNQSIQHLQTIEEKLTHLTLRINAKLENFKLSYTLYDNAPLNIDFHQLEVASNSIAKKITDMASWIQQTQNCIDVVPSTTQHLADLNNLNIEKNRHFEESVNKTKIDFTYDSVGSHDLNQALVSHQTAQITPIANQGISVAEKKSRLNTWVFTIGATIAVAAIIGLSIATFGMGGIFAGIGIMAGKIGASFLAASGIKASLAAITAVGSTILASASLGIAALIGGAAVGTKKLFERFCKRRAPKQELNAIIIEAKKSEVAADHAVTKKSHYSSQRIFTRLQANYDQCNRNGLGTMGADAAVKLTSAETDYLQQPLAKISLPKTVIVEQSPQQQLIDNNADVEQGAMNERLSIGF